MLGQPTKAKQVVIYISLSATMPLAAAALYFQSTDWSLHGVPFNKWWQAGHSCYNVYAKGKGAVNSAKQKWRSGKQRVSEAWKGLRFRSRQDRSVKDNLSSHDKRAQTGDTAAVC